MGVFRFKQFNLHQETSVMKFGTDSMLLGCFAEADGAKHILDVGTGSGILALMMAQRSFAKILAIDNDEAAVQLARKNFAESPWTERLEAISADFRDFNASVKFDLILSNPPFFRDNGQYQAEKRQSMRSNIGLGFEDLIQAVLRNLAENGVFWLILPTQESEELQRIALSGGLFLNNEILIRSFSNETPIRRILCFSNTPAAFQSRELVIYRRLNRYTEEYIELTKEYHLGEGAYFSQEP